MCGTKRSLLVDGEGISLAVVVGPANRTDMKLLEATLDAVVVRRPRATRAQPQHRCADKGYDYPEGRAQAAARDYTPAIRSWGRSAASGRWRIVPWFTLAARRSCGSTPNTCR